MKCQYAFPGTYGHECGSPATNVLVSGGPCSAGDPCFSCRSNRRRLHAAMKTWHDAEAAFERAYMQLFAGDHALSRFDWGKSFLRAQDIRELNELPGVIKQALGGVA